MQASTRIPLLLVAAVAVVAGWWILQPITRAVIGIIYSVSWTVIVLIVAPWAWPYRFTRGGAGPPESTAARLLSRGIA